MNIFYEKADEMIVKECKVFVDKNGKEQGNKKVASESLLLTDKLIKSLIESQKDYNDKVRALYYNVLKIANEKGDSAALVHEIAFNNYSPILVLDQQAHMILAELNKIWNNNR